MLAVKAMPVEAQVFQAWYFALHPEKLNPAADTAQCDSIFPGLRAKSRGAQKKALRKAELLRRGATNQIITNQRTDRQALIIGS